MIKKALCVLANIVGAALVIAMGLSTYLLLKPNLTDKELKAEIVRGFDEQREFLKEDMLEARQITP